MSQFLLFLYRDEVFKAENCCLEENCKRLKKLQKECKNCCAPSLIISRSRLLVLLKHFWLHYSFHSHWLVFSDCSITIGLLRWINLICDRSDQLIHSRLELRPVLKSNLRGVCFKVLKCTQTHKSRWRVERGTKQMQQPLYQTQNWSSHSWKTSKI